MKAVRRDKRQHKISMIFNTQMLSRREDIYGRKVIPGGDTYRQS